MENWVHNPLPIEQTDPEFANLLLNYYKTKNIPKVGRNEPCPCGAVKNGKRIKYKNCHGRIQ
ncbi:MAG: hypothetical protein PHF86_15130 [Candidatus Nanoarchaeia archaeon]|jgi:uncharacterized protein YchJ|nr:hypothetical protein [Candidatus Nanoarchaeia archaeon]